MAMPTSQAPAKMRSAISCCMCLLIFIIAAATLNELALVKADHPSPPSTLVLYVFEDRISADRTDLIVVSPSGNYNGTVVEFGTIAVVTNPLGESQAEDSPVGQVVGQVTVAKDGSLYVSVAFVLSTPNYAGSITVQGTTDASGNGELAITGGTGDFRWAKGYIDLSLITDEDEQNVVLKAIFYIKYI